jgi:citrate/tricarballylate utilization protein
MPSTESVTLREARRIMEVCNACRYCGGFCAVFPAMEKRRSFSRGDLEYLANLCHHCVGCFHACQYAPPQEFNLNLPRVMATLRAETYAKYAWPAPLAALLRNNGRKVWWISFAWVAVCLLLILLFQGAAPLFSVHAGAGAFYRVVPYAAMVGIPGALFLFALLCLVVGLTRFVRGTGWGPARPLRPRHLAAALRDVLALRYLGGGGDGCNDLDETFSHRRRWLHQAVFYGALSCLVSTTVAAVYDHILHRIAPYSPSSLPVVTGTLGGIALLIGTGGLFWLKLRQDQRPVAEALLGMDIAFSLQLFLISLTGLLLLLLRGTAAMGGLLAVHLGLVAGLFLVLPYGKFIHAAYRLTALVRFAAEETARNAPDESLN